MCAKGGIIRKRAISSSENLDKVKKNNKAQ